MFEDDRLACALAKRSSAALAALDRLKAAQAGAGRQGRYAQRSRELREATGTLGPLAKVAGELRARGAPWTPPTAAADLLDRVTKLSSEVARRPEILLEDDPKRSQFLWSELRRVPDAVKHGITESWRTYVADSLARSDPAGVLPTLDGGLHDDPDTRRALELAADLERLSTKSLPAAPEDFNSLENLSAELAEVLPRLEGRVTVPPEVAAFLRLARTPDGAPLSLYTHVVRDWLETNGEPLRYRVRRS